MAWWLAVWRAERTAARKGNLKVVPLDFLLVASSAALTDRMKAARSADDSGARSAVCSAVCWAVKKESPWAKSLAARSAFQTAVSSAAKRVERLAACSVACLAAR